MRLPFVEELPPAERQQPAVHLREHLVEVRERSSPCRRPRPCPRVSAIMTSSCRRRAAGPGRSASRSSFGVGHEVPVPRPGGVVDLDEASMSLRSWRRRIGRTRIPCSDSTFSASSQITGRTLSRPETSRLHISRSIALLKPGRLEQPRVVGGVPGRQDDRRQLVALDQHPALVVGREVHRPDHALAAALAQPASAASAARAAPPGRPRTRTSRTGPSACPGTR